MVIRAAMGCCLVSTHSVATSEDTHQKFLPPPDDIIGAAAEGLRRNVHFPQFGADQGCLGVRLHGGRCTPRIADTEDSKKQAEEEGDDKSEPEERAACM